MVYEVTLVYGEECKVVKHTIMDVSEVKAKEGTQVFKDSEGFVKAIFTNDAILSVVRVSLG